MTSITIKPRNAAEKQKVLNFVKRTKLRSVIDQEKKIKKKQEFLDGISRSMEEVNLHMQGKIELKDANELLNEL